MHQLRIAEPKLLVAHPENLRTTLDAMRELGIPEERVVLLEGNPAPHPHPSIDQLVQSHDKYREYAEHRLRPGEAKKTIAFLCFSSGTTGLPKVCRYRPCLSCTHSYERVSFRPSVYLTTM